MSTPLAKEAHQLGELIAAARGTTCAALFLSETLESENARRLVLRELRKRHPEESYLSLWSLVDEQLGHGPDLSPDADAIVRDLPPRYVHPVRVYRQQQRRSA